MTDVASEHRVVLIRIRRSAPTDRTDDKALYEATRQWWRIAEARTDGGPASPTHALAVVGGHVRAAYAIDGWSRRPADGRWSFTGRRADGPVAGYVGGDVRHYFPPGAANPVRFLHCARGPATTGAAEALKEADAAPARSVEAEVAALVRRIDAEPLAHIMFGHRELFHSNLLAWFFEALPDAADRVFGVRLPPGTETERRVEREREHLDLVVTIPDKQRLVIENKVFSAYDAEQLKEQAALVATWPGKSRLVLLSMLDPTPDPAWRGGTLPTQHGEWHAWDYVQLASTIIAALSGVEETYEVATMRHYAHLVMVLQQLITAVGVRSLDEPWELPEETVTALGTRQLAHSMNRLRARHVAQLVGTALLRAGAGGDMESGYAAAGPGVGWKLDVEDEEGRRVIVGWQLEGSAFRRILEIPHLAGRTPELVQQRFDYAAAHKHWFDFATTDTALGTAEMPVRPAKAGSRMHGFNKFDPDFVYRYKPVPELTVRQLIDAALAVAASVG